MAAMDGHAQMSQPMSGAEFPADLKRTQSVPVTLGPPAQQALQPLLQGWIEMKDPEGRPLYLNPATGQSSWQRPTIQTLPIGWQSMQTPDGKEMFVHLETGAVSYERPGTQSTQSAPSQPTPQQPIEKKVTRVVVQRPRPDSKPLVSSFTNADVGVRTALPRSMTAPVTGTATINNNINTGGIYRQALQTFPGAHQAQLVHQLSENNNVKVLSKKLASDVAQTSITAASLATRQAKTVGKMLISPKKLQRFSKKVVVQTGAMSVRAGRACKVVVNEMVDTADGRGQYSLRKDQRTFVPYSVNAPKNAITAGYVPAQTPLQSNMPIAPQPASILNPQPIALQPVPVVTPQPNATLMMGRKPLSRMPTRKPVGSGGPISQTVSPSTTAQASTSEQIEMMQAQSNAAQPNQYEDTIAGKLHDTHISPQISGQQGTDVANTASTTSPISPTGPPSYQQAVQNQSTTYQHPEIQNLQAGSTSLHNISNYSALQVPSGAQMAVNFVQPSQSTNVSSPENTSHVVSAQHNYVSHNELPVHLSSNHVPAQHFDYGNVQSNMTSQQDLTTYLQMANNYQQNQQTTGMTQPNTFVQNTTYVQTNDSVQMSGYNQTINVLSGMQPINATQSMNSNQAVLYDQVTSVDNGNVTVTEEEIVYVDENGNVISEDMLTVTDDNTGSVYAYQECDVNGIQCGTDVDIGGVSDDGDCDFDF